MKYFSIITLFVTILFSQYQIEGRWHLFGYEDNVMYQFENNYRYSIYSIDGNFGGLEDAGGSPNPYTLEQNIITLDLFFGNIVSYQMNYRCDGQVLDFIYSPDDIIHSTLFREGYSYINNTCIEYGDINQDTFVNVSDIVILVNWILNNVFDESGDLDENGSINVSDIVKLVSIILNQEEIPNSGLFFSQQFEEEELTFFYDVVYSERSNMNGLQYSSSQNQQEDQFLDNILLELDIAMPPNLENNLLPMVILIHGGGFYSGSKEALWQDTKDYATLGYIACTINYRLTPQDYQNESESNQMQILNDSVEDAMNAIRFLKSQADIYNIDNNRIATIGKSAGAFISIINAIERDNAFPNNESINDYPGISSSVLSSVTTGTVISNEYLILMNFNDDDASCLIMHSQDFDPVTERSWEEDVIPFYESIINSGNIAVLVPQPSNSHTVPIGPFNSYSENIIPFLWNQLYLNEY